MAFFQVDNPLLRLNLTLEDLANLRMLKGATAVAPEHIPLLTGVEPVREKNAPVGAPQTASRYNLVFPGSGFLRIAVKVEERAPSISQEVIDKYGGAIRVTIEGFTSGTFETDDGGARPYFKAAKIAPLTGK